MSTAQSYSNYGALQVELMSDGVVLATLDRPERLNAFNGGMRHSNRALLHPVSYTHLTLPTICSV